MTKILLDAGVEAPYIHKNKGLCFFLETFFFFRGHGVCGIAGQKHSFV